MSHDQHLKWSAPAPPLCQFTQHRNRLISLRTLNITMWWWSSFHFIVHYSFYLSFVPHILLRSRCLPKNIYSAASQKEWHFLWIKLHRRCCECLKALKQAHRLMLLINHLACLCYFKLFEKPQNFDYHKNVSSSSSQWNFFSRDIFCVHAFVQSFTCSANKKYCSNLRSRKR